jgi:hypothetical protein
VEVDAFGTAVADFKGHLKVRLPWGAIVRIDGHAGNHHLANLGESAVLAAELRADTGLTSPCHPASLLASNR